MDYSSSLKIAVIAAIIGALSTSTMQTIYDWIVAGNDRVVAQVYASKYQPNDNEKQELLKRQAEDERHLSELQSKVFGYTLPEIPDNTTADIEDKAYAVIKEQRNVHASRMQEVHTQLSILLNRWSDNRKSALFEGFRSRPHKLYTIQISNEGDRHANNVFIRISSAVNYQTEEKEFKAAESNLINLGRINQGDSITISIWSGVAFLESNLWQVFDRVSIGHEGGRAQTSLFTLVGGYAGWLDRNDDAIFFILPSLLFAVLLIVGVISNAKQKKVEQAKAHSSKPDGA